jgi:hypothetical protein
VETPIAKGILGGLYPAKSTVLIDAKPGDESLSIVSVPTPVDGTADDNAAAVAASGAGGAPAVAKKSVRSTTDSNNGSSVMQ